MKLQNIIHSKLLIYIGFSLILCIVIYNLFFVQKNSKIVEDFALFSSETNVEKRIKNNTLMPIDSNNVQFSHLLRDYYIFSSLGSCNDTNLYDDSTVSLKTLQNTLKLGARVIHLEVFTYNNDVVVGVSKSNSPLDIGSSNSLPFDSVIQTIRDFALEPGLCQNHSDPLILYLDIKTKLQTSYNEIASIITRILNPYLLNINYGNAYYGNNFGNVKLTDLIGKIVIMTNNDVFNLAQKSDLREIVNTTVGSQFIRQFNDNKVLFDSSLEENIDFNKQRITIVKPDNSSNTTKTYNTNSVSRHGCQIMLMPLLVDNKFTDYYIKAFQDKRFAFILKPVSLRMNPIVIEKPKEQDPSLSFKPKTFNGITI